MVHVGVFLFADELDGLAVAVGHVGFGFAVVEDSWHMRDIRVCGGRQDAVVEHSWHMRDI